MLSEIGQFRLDRPNRVVIRLDKTHRVVFDLFTKTRERNESLEVHLVQKVQKKEISLIKITKS